MDELLITPKRAAQLLGVGRTFVYAELLAKGRLESIKLGRRRLILREALDAFIARELADQSDATSVQPTLPPAKSGEENL